MKIFQMIQDYFSQKEEIDDSWGEDLADIYNNELADNVENWEIHKNENGEQIACQIK